MNEVFSTTRIATDVAILQAMTDRLNAYLERDRLHWPLVVETPQGTARPTMSLGALLSLQTRLQAVADELTPEQRALLARSQAELERARRWYPDAYRDHALKEMHGLLHTWRWFVEDCLADPERGRDHYVADVRARVTLQLLLDHLGIDAVPADLIEEIQAVDRMLGLSFAKGEFIWDPRLAPAFPPDRFWWLYGQPLVSHSRAGGAGSG